MFVRVGISPNNKYDPVEILAKLAYPPPPPPPKKKKKKNEKLCSYIFSQLFVGDSTYGIPTWIYLNRKQVLSMFVSLYLIKTPVTC